MKFQELRHVSIVIDSVVVLLLLLLLLREAASLLGGTRGVSVLSYVLKYGNYTIRRIFFVATYIFQGGTRFVGRPRS